MLTRINNSEFRQVCKNVLILIYVVFKIGDFAMKKISKLKVKRKFYSSKVYWKLQLVPTYLYICWSFSLRDAVQTSSWTVYYRSYPLTAGTVSAYLQALICTIYHADVVCLTINPLYIPARDGCYIFVREGNSLSSKQQQCYQIFLLQKLYHQVIWAQGFVTWENFLDVPQAPLFQI